MRLKDGQKAKPRPHAISAGKPLTRFARAMTKISCIHARLSAAIGLLFKSRRLNYMPVLARNGADVPGTLGVFKTCLL
jgi:hypothetical protein